MLAPAKINLCLFVGGTRADGRHELVSLMQSLAWGDEVTLEPAAADEVVCAGVDGPNLAAAALAAVPDGRSPLRVTIDKRIPIAAGLGGGSADAAAILRAIGGQAPFLHDVATSLGADVPAQLQPGRSLATGAGEAVERLAPPPAFGVLVVPSPHALSTADVYREADRLEMPRSPADLAARLAEVRAGIGLGPFGLAEELLINDLEPAAFHLCPSIALELDRVKAVGADHAMVSGSGPTVLGLFADPAAAEAAALEIEGSVATTPLETA